MNILHAIDDAVIDRVFQPTINRLQVSSVVHAAMPCYALCVGAQAGRAVVLHTQGLLGERAPGVVFSIVVACLVYGTSVLRARMHGVGRTRPNKLRHNPICRFGRPAGLLLELALLSAWPFVWPIGAEALLSWGASALWGTGIYFDSCESPPLQRRCQTVPDAI